MKNARYEYIDIARSIGISLIILWHAMTGVHNTSQGIIIQPEFYNVLNTIATYSVHLLFFISGLCATNIKNTSPLKFIIKLIQKFVIPYFLWAFLVCLIKVNTNDLQVHKVSFDNFFISYKVMFEQYWYLYILFLIELFVYIFDKLDLKILFLIIAITMFFRKEYVAYNNILYKFSEYTIYFMTGNVIGSVINKEKFENVIDKYKYIMIFLYIITYTKFLSINLIGVGKIYTYIKISIGIFFIFSISYLISKYLLNIKKFFIFVGEHSMEYYCLHPTVSGIVRVAYIKFFGRELPYLRTCVIFLLTIIILTIIFRIWKGKDIIYQLLFGKRNLNI